MSDSMYGTEKNFFLRNYIRFSIVPLSPHSSCCLQNFIFLFEFTVSLSDFLLISALGTLEGVIILNHRNKKTKTPDLVHGQDTVISEGRRCSQGHRSCGQ